ncbi:MAG TPA: GNAT family acetyltransferase [Acetobacteraceae bacterium]|jgi:ribosomal protein S18 acetylase RimI-like enzyme|nr:GNAT family acetyltransferase [Acetobacteraceae bacterium]
MTKAKQDKPASPRPTIRSATAKDETRVTALWRACNLVTSCNDPSQDFRFARAKEGSAIVVGLKHEQAIVGSVMVGHGGHRGWIYDVASYPKHRTQGIGRSMVEAAEQWLKNKGVVKVMLLVRETNTQVVEFYKRLGFEAVPRVIMQKWLEEGHNESVTAEAVRSRRKTNNERVIGKRNQTHPAPEGATNPTYGRSIGRTGIGLPISIRARRSAVKRLLPRADIRAPSWGSLRPFLEPGSGHGVQAAAWPARAASILAMSILRMVIMAFIARFAAARSGSFSAAIKARGTICHQKPQRSLHQLHSPSLPPFPMIAFQ